MFAVSPILVGITAVPLQVDIDMGWLPDAIWRAFVAVWRTIMGQGISELLQLGVIPLLEVPNPSASPEAITAWQSVFGLALTLLPILIAAGVVVTPFSPDQDSSLWRQALRVIAVIFFIAISKPVIGFAVDATNAITMELAPEAFTLSFGMNLQGLVGQFTGWTIGVIIYTLVFGAMLIAVLVTTLLLALRIYLVYFLFVSVPFLAVLWYADWGPLETVSEYGAMFMRVGVYALLAGPVIALLLRVAEVIGTGGLITNTAGSNPAAQFWASLVLVVMIPILMIVGVWMSISFAGQPLGVGKMANLAIAGLAVMAGAAVGGSVGAAAGSKVGLGGGGGSSGGTGSSRGGAGGGRGGSAVATDPAVGTGNSMVGSGISHDLDDVFADADQAVEEDLAPHLNAPFRTEAKLRASGSARVLTPNIAKSAGSWVKGKGGKAKEKSKEFVPNVSGAISSRLDETQEEFQAAATAAAYHGNKVGFLTDALEKGELNVSEAIDRDLLAFDPADIGPVPIEDGTAMVETPSGREVPVNVENLQTMYRTQFNAALSDAKSAGRKARQLETLPHVPRSVGRSAATMPLKGTKTGARVTAGALSGHPYFAYRIGKSGRQRELLLAPDTRRVGDHVTQISKSKANMDTT